MELILWNKIIIFLLQLFIKSLKELSQSFEKILLILEEISSNATHYLNSTKTTMNEKNKLIKDTAYSLEKVCNLSSNNRTSTEKVIELTNYSNTQVDKGAELIKKFFENMHEIQKSNNIFTTSIKEFISHINHMSELLNVVKNKVSVIDQIVFQTKLLSFNASIEAARAGAAGRGFSVVASEIGKLASNSGASANEIHNIIETTDAEMSDLIANIGNKLDELLSHQVHTLQQGQDSAKDIEESLKIISLSSKKIHQEANLLNSTISIQDEGMTNVLALLDNYLKRDLQSNISIVDDPSFLSKINEANEIFGSITDFLGFKAKFNKIEDSQNIIYTNEKQTTAINSKNLDDF